MKLIVISNPVDVNKEHVLISSLFEAGLDYYHLRKPDFTCRQMELYIQKIPVQYWSRVVLHSHHQLAEKYELKGIHYTRQNPYSERNLFSGNSHRSCSVHSLEELKSVESVFQYVFLSPVFDSISKKGYDAAFDKTQLKGCLKTKSNTEVIALGGIDEHTISEAMALGFDGVALLGALWLSPDPLKKFSSLQNSLEAMPEIKKEHHV